MNITHRRIATLAGTSLAVVALVGCGSSSTPDSGPAPSHDKATTVVTKLLSFGPEKLTVKAGTTVTWSASDSIGHTVTTGTFTAGSNGLRTAEHPDGLIDMPLRGGKDVSFTFDKPGRYVYYCLIHKGMSGEIDVTP
ncbi:plastocyanin [Marmoricola sp. URHA0025 HA25]